MLLQWTPLVPSNTSSSGSALTVYTAALLMELATPDFSLLIFSLAFLWLQIMSLVSSLGKTTHFFPHIQMSTVPLQGMPYNVITMVCTLLALFFGTIFNATTRKLPKGYAGLEDSDGSEDGPLIFVIWNRVSSKFSRTGKEKKD